MFSGICLAIADTTLFYFQLTLKLTDKIDCLAGVGSKVGVDIVVDWHPQVLHAPDFEAVGMIAGGVDDVCNVMVFECTGIQCVSGVT